NHRTSGRARRRPESTSAQRALPPRRGPRRGSRPAGGPLHSTARAPRQASVPMRAGQRPPHSLDTAPRQMETTAAVMLTQMKRLLGVLLLLAACRHEAMPQQAYQQEIEQWRARRRASLTEPDGWLSLVALDWLHEGSNDITLPARPPVTCRFVLQNGRVTLEPNAQLGIAAPTVLRDDTDQNGPTVVHAGSLSFEAIKRSDVGGDRFGIRARDPRSDARTHFKGLDYFPVNPAFRVEARFEPYRPPKKIPITNVLGMTSDETSPGALVFTLQGKTFRIDPILEQGETDLFIIFK